MRRSDPAPELRDPALGTPGRPSWRGRVHLIALFSAVPLSVLLAVHAAGARSRAGVIVYGVGLCAMLAVSTTYHRWVHTTTSRQRWRRADHATIFAAIAGTGTALAMTSLATGPAIVALISIWAAALAGAVFKLISFERAHGLGSAMYVALGWSGVLLAPAVWQRSGAVTVVLLAGGGAVYTAGAVAFARQWPKLRPSTFSYHEVWHVFTVVAAGLHFTAVGILAT
jgi:hemolysin III